jgi:hypothetical protein
MTWGIAPEFVLTKSVTDPRSGRLDRDQWCGAASAAPWLTAPACDTLTHKNMIREDHMLRIGFIALVVAAFGVVAQAQQAPVLPSPVKRTPIGKSDVPNSNYEVITAMVEIVPGFKAGRHSHPGIVQAQVLEGEFMLALDGQPEKTFKAAWRHPQ